MRSFKVLFLLLLLPLIAFNVVHEYYVSVTEITHVKEQKSVQIISRVFIDDLEKMLQERHSEDIILNVGEDEAYIDKYIELYYHSKLKITINEELQEFKYLGKEYEDDIVFSYIEITGIDAINSIEVTNEILFDVFLDQQNIVKIKTAEKNKSFILIPNNKTRLLNFN